MSDEEKNSVSFTAVEEAVMYDAQFLHAKHRITEKVFEQFRILRDELKKILNAHTIICPDETDLTMGKISKGENYKELPYLVLDFPKHFNKEEIFAYRSLFLWGNFYSFSLLMEGEIKRQLEDKCASHYASLTENKFYLCVNESKWEWLMEENNFRPVHTFSPAEFRKFIHEHPFIKLTRIIELRRWREMVEFGTETFKLLLSILKSKCK